MQHKGLPKELDHGVFTTSSETRAAAYANNHATPQSPPVVIAVDADALKPRVDIDAYATWIPTQVDDILRLVDDVARRAAAGDPQAVEELERELDTEAGDYDGDPTETVADALFEDPHVSGAAVLNAFTANGYEGQRLAEIIVAVLDGEQEVPEPVLAQLMDQYRYPHDIPVERILWATLYYAWKNEPVREYEDPGEDEHIDGEGYYVFDQEGMYNANLYGWLPDRGRVWENPQLRLFDVKAIQYHGTTWESAQQILENQPGWTELAQQVPVPVQPRANEPAQGEPLMDLDSLES